VTDSPTAARRAADATASTYPPVSSPAGRTSCWRTSWATAGTATPWARPPPTRRAPGADRFGSSRRLQLS